MSTVPTPRLQVWGVAGLPEVRSGDDLAALVATAAPDLRDGDILVVTSKVVSKAEGRLVAGEREAHIDAESVRLVARRGRTRIVETRHGLVLAAAGIDASNVPLGTIALLPVDPDASARQIRTGVAAVLGVEVAVIVSDTMGRPWRNGVTDVAIGASGLDVLIDLRGANDAVGRPLEATVIAVADELAAAADLVKGKLTHTPVAVIRGFPRSGSAAPGPGATAPSAPESGAAELVRPAGEDMFRLGSREAMDHVVSTSAPLTALTDVQQAAASHAVAWSDAVARAVAAASAAPTPMAVVPAVDGTVRVLVDGSNPVAVGLAAGRLLAALAAEDLRGLVLPAVRDEPGAGTTEISIQVVPPSPTPSG